MIVLLHGLPGATNLRDDARVIKLLKEMKYDGKFVCAMCAASSVLRKACVLERKNFTAYIGYDKKVETPMIHSILEISW